MKKQKFTITKHNRANGTSYYTCTVEVESVRRPESLIELFKYWSNGVPCIVEYSLDTSGDIYTDYKCTHDTRAEVLNTIERYIEDREIEEGQKVVSTEIEVIYK